MKKLIYSIIAILFVTQISLAEKIEVSKEYQETYPVNAQTNFKIENKFGDIIIADWDKDEISINVVIKIKARNKERAEEYLSYITSKIKKEGNSVSAKTIFDEKWKNHKKVEIDIKYIIKAPSYLTYDINNKFGNIAIAKITGPTSINLKYGNLLAQELIFSDHQDLNKIKLSYSKADIKYCNYADIDVKFGKLKFGIGKALKLDASYSDVDIKKLETLHFEGKHGGFDLDTIDIAQIDAKYMNVDIAYMSSKLNAELKYGNLNVNNVTPFFSEIKVDASFGNVKLLIHPDAVYHIDADVDYGDLNLPKKVNID